MDTADMIEQLEDVVEALSDFVDIDSNGGPNVEMRSIAKLEAVIAALRKGGQS